VYDSLDKRAKTSLVKQVVDMLDDRQPRSRDRVVPQHIID